jgi:hypothetical protein
MASEKTRNGGEWTEARYNSFVKGGLRSISQRWPPRYASLNTACIGQRINAKTGRWAKHYVCAACEAAFPAKDVQVDHIVPVGKFETWDKVIENMFCEGHNLQVLCKDCHNVKTQLERNNERK